MSLVACQVVSAVLAHLVYVCVVALFNHLRENNTEVYNALSRDTMLWRFRAEH